MQGRTDPRPDQLHLLSPFSRTEVIHGLGPLYETCNIFYPRELLEELGGFAADTYALPAGEDTDLAWRALERGARASTSRGRSCTTRCSWRAPSACSATHCAGTPPSRCSPGTPALRREHLHRGIFWSDVHEHLLRFLLGLVVRAPFPACRRSSCAGPYLVRLLRRRSGPLLAPYILLLDIVELGVRAARGPPQPRDGGLSERSHLAAIRWSTATVIRAQAAR